MKRLLFCALLVLVLAGCGSGKYHIPKQEYQSKVQVLGVLPLLVDHNSTLVYPEKEILFEVLSQSASGKHEQLVALLKEEKGYFDVRMLNASPKLTALSLIGAGSSHDKNGWPNGYAVDAATVAEIARQNVLDAVLIVIFSAERINENRRSRTKLESLNTVYSEILATATVVDRSGKELWQLAGTDSYRALVVQYADFDEAYYNKTNTVQVKNISMAGVERALDESADKDGKLKLPEMYADLFAEISSGISPSLLDSLRLTE